MNRKLPAALDLRQICFLYITHMQKHSVTYEVKRIVMNVLVMNVPDQPSGGSTAHAIQLSCASIYIYY